MVASEPLPKLPSFNLGGRQALVTGGGRGLGRAVASALAEAGAEVTVVARTATEIEEVADQITERGDKAQALVLDVTDTAQVSNEVSKRGPFQILVNNAGTNRPADLLSITEADYDLVTDLNVRSTIFLTQAVARGLIDAGLPGSIINMSSTMGHVGGPKRTVYCATKHAVEGATKAIAWELGQHQIRINTICPTFVETPMTKPMLADQDFCDFVTSNIALGRLGQVEDVMGAALYLASDASSLVTGSALMIDGGWTAA
jgi:NAD(P)-dependent dehydrogenase (short-subunit alcohol dehydrogenase family)